MQSGDKYTPKCKWLMEGYENIAKEALWSRTEGIKEVLQRERHLTDTHGHREAVASRMHTVGIGRSVLS